MAWAVPVERLPRLGWQLGAAFLLYVSPPTFEDPALLEKHTHIVN